MPSLDLVGDALAPVSPVSPVSPIYPALGINAKHRSMATVKHQHQAQIVPAPARPTVVGQRSVFLAGTITKTARGVDWRDAVIEALSHLPVTIFNPLRPDWDSSWREDVEFHPFREQVEWELDMQDHADIVFVYYGPGTEAPISRLELGLAARQGKAMVTCHRDYKKRGNVHIVSQRLGIEFLDADEDFISSMVRKVESLLSEEDVSSDEGPPSS
ncbi:hypothetical protein B0T18DRAFT_413753 [Schizothecium vesticola]|uniref:Uncharacterized protein n=1 Tax=Schizothecium vesticola TaxID=314040 RepID=A0AA40ENX2_9PEZI|nr:hypothetical protein B0T18DRAFT_413753 [Schizothecium vesticola]